MGIFDFLSGEFIDVIHWTDDTRDTMVWRFEREGHEIKYGAKLTVREGQAAVFVHEGQLADVFTPGLYMLETNNMPIMTTLQHWDHGFKARSNPRFISSTPRAFNDLKWGTKNPIMCAIQSSARRASAPLAPIPSGSPILPYSCVKSSAPMANSPWMRSASRSAISSCRSSAASSPLQAFPCSIWPPIPLIWASWLPQRSARRSRNTA